MNDDFTSNDHELKHPDLMEKIEEARSLRRADELESSQALLLEPVSYTHLTLPTSDLV